MYLIGLTGGIAAGKSTIARRLAGHGAVVIDADQIAREVVEPGTPALGQIARVFGPEILQADGTLDRAELGGRVFGDPNALARLNAIVHPAVGERTEELIAEAAAADPDAVVVYDVPLLVEAAVKNPFNLVVVAHAPAETRIERLVTLRGMSESDARARATSQASDADRLRAADVVIDTARDEEHTLAQADDLWQDIQLRLAQEPS